MDQLYALLSDAKTDTALAFLVTASNRSVEIAVYKGIIIAMKVRGVTLAEAWQEIASNQVRGVNLAAGEVRPNAVIPEAIVLSFPTVRQRLMPDRESVIRRHNDVVRVMGALGALGEKPARRALDTMSIEVRTLLPEFVRTAYSVSDRWKVYRSEFHVEAIPPADATPAGDCDTLVWAVGSADALEPGPVAEGLLLYAFAGLRAAPMVGVRARRESGFFVKGGAIKLSKPHHQPRAAGRENALVYSADKRAGGPFSVTWLGDDTSEAVIPRTDFDSMKLRDGQDVNVVFVD